MNNWIFIGNLGKDAVINVLKDGTNVINFSVAITEKYVNKSSGEVVENTTWVSCSKFGAKTAVAQYLKQGTLVCVAGRPTARAYQKATGELQAQLQCTVFELDLIGGKKETAGAPEAPIEQEEDRFGLHSEQLENFSEITIAEEALVAVKKNTDKKAPADDLPF